jgi:hypothetical protein
MKNIGWVLLLLFMLIIAWNTRLYAPVSGEAIGFDIWSLAMFYLTFLAGRKVFRVFRRKRPATNAQASAATPTEVVEVDDHIRLTTTEEWLNKSQGWEHWDLYPKKLRLLNECCFGGPPTFNATYEYRVEGTEVMVRLIEECKEGFDGKRYTVFKGQVVRAQVENDSREEVEKEVQRLQSKTAWHEADPVMRYFVLANTAGHADFLREEHSRLEEAYETVAQQAAKISAVRGRFGIYEVPADASEEAKKIATAFSSNANLLRFGLTFQELRSQEVLLALTRKDAYCYKCAKAKVVAEGAQ